MNKVQFFYADEDGDERHSTFWINPGDATHADAQMVALRDAAQACSNATLNQVTIHRLTDIVDPPAAGDGPYSVQDKLVMLLLTAAGTYCKVVLPGPVAAILVNDDALNIAHASVSAWLVEAQACLTDQFGSAVSSIVKGWRERASRL